MKFCEIFEDVSAKELNTIQDMLNSKVWMPDSLMKQNGDVIKLVLPQQSHFSQRTQERAASQSINAREIATLLANVKSDPSNPFYDELRRFSVDDNANHTINVSDPISGLTIPLAIRHNRDAFYTSPDSAVGGTRSGERVPKNIAMAKSILRRPMIGPVDTNAHDSDTFNTKQSDYERSWNRYSDLDDEFNK